jgi:hypothetical protein
MIEVRLKKLLRSPKKDLPGLQKQVKMLSLSLLPIKTDGEPSVFSSCLNKLNKRTSVEYVFKREGALYLARKCDLKLGYRAYRSEKHVKIVEPFIGLNVDRLEIIEVFFGKITQKLKYLLPAVSAVARGSVYYKYPVDLGKTDLLTEASYKGKILVHVYAGVDKIFGTWEGSVRENVIEEIMEPTVEMLLKGTHVAVIFSADTGYGIVVFREPCEICVLPGKRHITRKDHSREKSGTSV